MLSHLFNMLMLLLLSLSYERTDAFTIRRHTPGKQSLYLSTAKHEYRLNVDVDGFNFGNFELPESEVESGPFPDKPLPIEVSRQMGVYDSVYVERLKEIAKSSGGLFLPGQENPKMHVARVISFGPGREQDNGHVIKNEGLEIGDLVFIKNPLGIGPRDEEFTDEDGVLRRFSFIRYQDVAAVVRK